MSDPAMIISDLAVVHAYLGAHVRNRDVRTGKISNAFTSHYLLGRDDQGRVVLELYEDDTGIVMKPIPGRHAWLKSEFSLLAKADAPEELLARGRADFHADNNDQLRQMRTVGCGTNVLFVLSDGIYYAAVERTAPKQTDDGAVNPGAYSRAAGGSMLDIDSTALRELLEEMFVVAQIDGQDTAIHIIPEAYQVHSTRKQALLEERRERFPQILDAHGQNQISLRGDYTREAPCIAVPGLTEDVVERTVEGNKILTNRVFGDAPHQMDVNGVDAIAVVRLPSLSSKDIRGIFDGEVNQKGDLLRRKWGLYPIDEIHGRLVRQEIVMSPVPGRVVMAKDDVVKAIHAELGL